MGPLEERLLAIVQASRTLFPDFDFLQPGGVLHIRLTQVTIDRLRIELPTSQFLHLQSVGLTTTDDISPAGLAARTKFEASSWYADTEQRFDAEALFDFDNPTGTTIHTGRGPASWVEMTFNPPLEISEIRLRNVGRAFGQRARGVRVHVGSPGADHETVYDSGARADELQTLLHALAHQSPAEIYEDLLPLTTILGLTIVGRYAEARALMKSCKAISPDARKEYRRAVNQGLLIGRSVEWTAHGPQRSFRFWTEAEKFDYIQFAVSVVDDLTTLSSSVAFGFGAALAVVRNGDLIPHDDDLDLIIGFEPDEATTLAEAHALVENFLRPLGYSVTGEFFGHRHVSKPGHKKVDVFVAIFEGDHIAWYPGTRGSLHRDDMFPLSTGTMLGVSCPLPRSPLIYLETLYGPDWRNPDPAFKHSWSKKPFADFTDSSSGGAARSAAPPTDEQINPDTSADKESRQHRPWPWRQN